MKKLIYMAAVLLTVSCVKGPGMIPVGGKVAVTVEVPQTRTAIEGNQISFIGGETISLVCRDMNAAKLSNKGISVDKFSGELDATGKSKAGAQWYAIYPYVGVAQGGNERCFLPLNQKAPFDGDANFMCSDVVVADYDEAAMPALSMSMNQLLGIVRISLTNSSESYQNDLLQDVVLTSSTPLAGEFVVKFDVQGKPVPEFKGTGGRVISSFVTPVALGLNKAHEVYLSVNPAEIKDAVITVRTDKHEFRRAAKSAFKAVQGDLTYMDPMDVASSFTVAEADVKTLVLWGDSYTNRGYEYTHVDRCNYAYHLGKMLGSGWKIYNGGSSGDVTNTIAARQGGIQLRTGAAFTIPAGTVPVAIDGLFSSKNFWFDDGSASNPSVYTKISRFGLINPMEIIVEDASGNEIARVEGNITYSGSEATNFTRTTAGEAVDVPAYSKVLTFAAKNLRNPDLTIIYMGQNGGFKSLDILYNQYRAMIDYAFPEGPEHYIVLGFHNHDTVKKWNEGNAYWDFFGGARGFGVNEAEGRPISRFVNLYAELTGEKYAEYLAMTGAAASPADVSDVDKEYVAQGMIPRSYWFSPFANDIHPNEYGAKAFAALIYNKMVELGYVE